MAPTRNTAMSNHTKAGWRVQEWADDVGISRAFTWKLISAGDVQSVKVGNARVIVTPPAEFLASRQEQGES